MSDSRREQLVEAVSALVTSQFRGDYAKAFQFYDSDNDSAISWDELYTLLADAGIGSRLTRATWARGVMGELDRDDSGKISWVEFEAALKRGQS